MLAPNEDDLMAERLVYGLIIWEYLTECQGTNCCGFGRR